MASSTVLSLTILPRCMVHLTPASALSPTASSAVWSSPTDRILTWMRQIPDATFMVATDAGHFVHADDPVLVTEAVRRVVEAARR